MKNKMRIRRSLDIYETIEKATLKIKAGYTAFFIETECGTIGLELDTKMDLMNPIMVEEWKTNGYSSRSEFYIQNVFSNTEFYAKIRCTKHTDADVVRAMICTVVSKCMVSSLCTYSGIPDLEEVLPLVQSLMDELPGGKYSVFGIKDLAVEYMKEELNKFKYVLSSKDQKKLMYRNISMMMERMVRHARVVMSDGVTGFYSKADIDVFCGDKFYQLLLFIVYTRVSKIQRETMDDVLFKHNGIAWIDTKYATPYYAIREIMKGKVDKND